MQRNPLESYNTLMKTASNDTQQNLLITNSSKLHLTICPYAVRPSYNKLITDLNYAKRRVVLMLLQSTFVVSFILLVQSFNFFALWGFQFQCT